MGAYRLELIWDVQSLYRLLVKRMANTGIEELESYLKGVPGLLHSEINGALGYVPADSEEAFRLVMKTADERVNIPEIYLHGFGLKRKGGIKRPKT